MSSFDIFNNTDILSDDPADKERQQSIVRRNRQNVACEVDKLPPVHGHRSKAQIDTLVQRLRTLNAFLWKKL